MKRHYSDIDIEPDINQSKNQVHRENSLQIRMSEVEDVFILEPPPVVQPYNDNKELIKCDDLTNNDVDVKITDTGRFQVHIRLPHKFYAYIIGTKGWKRKQLEQETKTEIMIPNGASDEKILITGSSEQSVLLARKKLEMIGYDLRKKHTITHFISFPLTSKEIKSNFLKFKELVLSQEHIDGVEESIFLKVDKIHLTICILVLLDDYEKDEALKILEEIKTEVVVPHLKSSPPLVINMKGLDYMNNDPSKVNVLYAKVQVNNHENADILQIISDEIANYFYKKGLIQQTPATVKLHATIINTKYRKYTLKTSGSKNRHQRMKSTSFDAQPILNKYSNFDFGEQPLNLIHLSDRFSTDASGYYKPIHTISCNFTVA